MRFTHGLDDTIVACATPPGGSARAILRLSGPAALAVASACLQIETRLMESHRRIAGRWPAKHGGVELAVYVMQAPRSYTAEDVVEVHLPGSVGLVGQVLSGLLEGGARLAQPGEFTYRAFLHGRLDLAQAEAVEALVAARSTEECRAALAGVAGRFSTQVAGWRERLVALAADLEGELDFEAAEVTPQVAETRLAGLTVLEADLTGVVAQAHAREVESGSIPVYLCGPTNAGKSSLCNALLGWAAALVSAEASTTRDRLDFEWVVEPFHFLLQDAPGQDSGPGELARLASARGAQEAGRAGILLIVGDGSVPPAPDWPAFLERLPALPSVLVVNQCDRGCHRSWREVVGRQPAGRRVCFTSARSGLGLDGLREAIIDLAVEDVEHVTSAGRYSRRVAQQLVLAQEAVREALALLKSDAGGELVAEALRQAHQAMASIMGEGYAEEVLESIFSRFCIGK